MTCTSVAPRVPLCHVLGTLLHEHYDWGTFSLYVVLQVRWVDPVSLTYSLSLTPNYRFCWWHWIAKEILFCFSICFSKGRERTVSFGNLNASFKVPLIFLVCRKLILQIGFTAMIGINFNATKLTCIRNIAKLALMIAETPVLSHKQS